MNRFIRLSLGLLTLGVLTTLCLGGLALYRLTAQDPGEETAAANQIPLNRIAFVGQDDNLWLASPDGEILRQLTSDGNGYRFPTWAPDGRRLAFIGPSDGSAAALHVIPVTGGEPVTLFDYPSAAPFYLYWSPDSRTVTFLTQEESGLALRAADADDPGSNRLLAQGSPFYWAWSPQGDWLLMHVGGARATSEEAHLSLLESSPGASREELKLVPGQFQVPLWSSDGQYIFYIAVDEEGQEAIYKTHLETLAQTLITELPGPTALVLSPTDRHLAYLVTPRRPGALGLAHVIDVDGKDERLVIEAPVAAMYWSPDGKKLALLVPSQGGPDDTARAAGRAAPLSQQRFFSWWIYEPETTSLTLLSTFEPTQQFLQTMPFFDQYHLSATYWSPDSRYLVTSLVDPISGDDTIWVLDTTEDKAPRQIGRGSWAVWSWQ